MNDPNFDRYLALAEDRDADRQKKLDEQEAEVPNEDEEDEAKTTTGGGGGVDERVPASDAPSGRTGER